MWNAFESGCVVGVERRKRENEDCTDCRLRSNKPQKISLENEGEWDKLHTHKQDSVVACTCHSSFFLYMTHTTGFTCWFHVSRLELTLIEEDIFPTNWKYVSTKTVEHTSVTRVILDIHQLIFAWLLRCSSCLNCSSMVRFAFHWITKNRNCEFQSFSNLFSIVCLSLCFSPVFRHWL